MRSVENEHLQPTGVLTFRSSYARLLEVCRSCSGRGGDRCNENGQTCQANARGENCPRGKFTTSRTESRALSIAVIVTNHNYDRYLEECLRSISRQTRPADQVVVVHDRCNPESLTRSQAIASRFRVHQLVTEFGDVQLARSAGIPGECDAVLFVDADNGLAVDFLLRSAEQLAAAGPQVAAVYPTIHRLGESAQLIEAIAESYDRDRFGRVNCIDACSLVWRHALESSWVRRGVGHRVFEDWDMWNQLADAGWQFEHCPRAVLYYRVHGQSMSAQEHATVWSETRRPSVTVFIPLSGRECSSRVFRAASRAARNATSCSEIRVVLCHTSTDPSFRDMVNRSASTILGSHFSDVRVYHQDLRLCRNLAGLADLDRRQFEYQVQLAICRIYNRFFAELQTDLAWIVEDDVLVPPNALEELLRELDPKTAAVSGVYGSRLAIDGRPLREGEPSQNVVAWQTGEDRYSVRLIRPAEIPNGPTIEVAGSGYGCLLIRREAVRLAPLAVTAREKWPDPRMFRIIREAGWRVKLATGVRCKHLCRDREPVEV